MRLAEALASGVRPANAKEPCMAICLYLGPHFSLLCIRLSFLESLDLFHLLTASRISHLRPTHVVESFQLMLKAFCPFFQADDRMAAADRHPRRHHGRRPATPTRARSSRCSSSSWPERQRRGVSSNGRLLLIMPLPPFPDRDSLVLLDGVGQTCPPLRKQRNVQIHPPRQKLFE